MSEQIHKWIQTNQLVRITAVKRKVGRKHVLGRILQADEVKQDILVYDDDQKQIHHLSFNEIDDIEPTA